MSNVPRAREILVELSQRLSDRGDAESAAMVEAALALMTRRKRAKPSAPVTSRIVDRRAAAEIRAYAKAHPWKSQQEVGEFFRVNHGRVSEALHHDR